MLNLFTSCALFWAAVFVLLQSVYKFFIRNDLGFAFLFLFLILVKAASFVCLYVFFVLFGSSFVDFALCVLFSFLLLVAWVLMLWRLGFLP